MQNNENDRKKTPSPRKIKYMAMEQIFRDAGYQVWQCHLTRIHLQGVMYIAVNQIAVGKNVHPYVVWRTLCTMFLLTLKGRHFTPEKVKAIWARAQKEGEEGKEVAPWLSGAVERGEECALCGGKMEVEPSVQVDLLGMELPAEVTTPGDK